MTKDEALKLVLEALEEPKEHIAKHRRLEAITAIREALAQPEQEPHCYMDEYGYVEGEMKRYMEEQGGWFPVYTHPPKREWVGLTEEEIVEVANAVRWSKQYHVDFARAIESLLWAKNS